MLYRTLTIKRNNIFDQQSLFIIKRMVHPLCNYKDLMLNNLAIRVIVNSKFLNYSIKI